MNRLSDWFGVEGRYKVSLEYENEVGNIANKMVCEVLIIPEKSYLSEAPLMNSLSE